MPQGEDWLTTDEIAKDLKVNVKTVRNWINSGELAAIDVGGEYRIYRKDYEDFINRRKIDRGKWNNLAINISQEFYITTHEDLNQQLRKVSPILSKKIRQCTTDEEASELLYTTLIEIVKVTAEGWRALLDARYPSERGQQSESTGED